MSSKISPQLEDKIKQYQTIQQKMSALQQQIQALKIEEMEIDKAIKEIEELPDTEVCYRSIGKLMIKSTIKETKEKLANQKDLNDTRINISEKSFDKLKKQNDELEETIRNALNTSK